MIVCLRTVAVPADVRQRYLEWIADGRAVRQGHGFLAELVLEPSGGGGGYLNIPRLTDQPDCYPTMEDTP